jgi:Ca2+-binding EF-hand superfamily protein
VLLRLNGIKMLHKLQFEMLELFTEFLQDDHIEKIRETFQAIDIDDSGSIEADELI